MKKVLSKSAEETMALGESIGEAARTLPTLFSMALTGDLGAGKTCLIQGLAKGLGVDTGYYITSPTFNIINEYPAGEKRLCHLDLYRLGAPDELEYIGFEDLLGTDAVVAVEWPDLLREDGFIFDLELRFEFDKDFNRIIHIIPSGKEGIDMLNELPL
ncbi:MAG: tRNA (adenosine(37)-N6)-threonylcarbamoyltransferase complex ATPase subunit type 1 TsaE [Desulfobacterales bacterium]|nr:tRNA (adenosine(37)-N6)-threonylcarbamoyltransferase complex ATPase subunit type 1 TsaE [Desulfobacterales bacterium]